MFDFMVNALWLLCGAILLGMAVLTIVIFIGLTTYLINEFIVKIKGEKNDEE